MKRRIQEKTSFKNFDFELKTYTPYCRIRSLLLIRIRRLISNQKNVLKVKDYITKLDY